MEEYTILYEDDLNPILFSGKDVFLYIENKSYLMFYEYADYCRFVKEISEKGTMKCYQVIIELQDTQQRIIFSYMPSNDQKALKKYLKLCIDLKTFPIISYNETTSCYQIVAEKLSNSNISREFYSKLISFMEEQTINPDTSNQISSDDKICDFSNYDNSHVINNYYIGSINNNTNGNNILYLRETCPIKLANSKC